MDWRYLFLSFEGRISRKFFWLGNLTLIITMLVLYQLAIWLGLSPSWENFGNPRSDTAWVGFIIQLMLLYPGLAIDIKRLHDRNRTGWWAALLYGVVLLSYPISLAGLAGTEDDPGTIFLVWSIAFLGLTVWLGIEMGFLKGTQGPNRFGPDPLGATRADATL